MGHRSEAGPGVKFPWGGINYIPVAFGVDKLRSSFHFYFETTVSKSSISQQVTGAQSDWSAVKKVNLSFQFSSEQGEGKWSSLNVHSAFMSLWVLLI